jgi:hypothetical protein
MQEGAVADGTVRTDDERKSLVRVQHRTVLHIGAVA